MARKLRHAPVYFAIVQARFNAITALDAYVPAIQEKLRKQGYPDFQKTMLATFNLNLGNPAEGGPPQVPVVQTARYLFSDMDRTAGFLLEQGALSYQTTNYDTYEAFSAAFLEGLVTVHEAVALSYTDRIGVRYLDAVYPGENEDLSHHLNGSVLGLYAALDGQLVHSFSETAVKAGDIQIVARTIIQEGEVGFPPDLPPGHLLLHERFRTLKGVHAILDTDCSQERRTSFNLDHVRERLSSIHMKVEKSFRATVTPHALQSWE